MSVVKLDRPTRPRSLDDYPDGGVLNLYEVAAILRRSPDRTRTWLRQGGIHAVRVGGQWRVAKSVLVAFLSGEGAGD
jgi:excisionase family DNA binding protein